MKKTALLFCMSAFTACSTLSNISNNFVNGTGAGYASSGTIILSGVVPSSSHLSLSSAAQGAGTYNMASNVASAHDAAAGALSNVYGAGLMAPLIGYFPHTAGFVPAENETWLELDRSIKKLSLYKGKSRIKEMAGEGDIAIAPGEYFVQLKQKRPLWYAPDQYFQKRHLTIPPKEDRLRYRRGALGPFAIFATTTFPIHTGAVWTNDVGGFRVNKTDLSSIYYTLPVGARIVVK